MMRALVVSLVLAAAVVLPSASASNGDSRDRALLGSLLAGMKTDLAGVQIRGLTAEWRSPTRKGKKLLRVSSQATTPARRVLDDWYGALIATAYNDQCGRKADHCLAVYEVIGGSGGGAIGRSGAKRPLAGRRLLMRQIRTRFAHAGLHVSSIRFEHPYALAPVVTVESHHPQRAANAYNGAVSSGLDIAGLFVRMVDARRRVFLVGGHAGSDSELWARRGIKLHNLL